MFYSTVRSVNKVVKYAHTHKLCATRIINYRVNNWKKHRAGIEEQRRKPLLVSTYRFAELPLVRSLSLHSPVLHIASFCPQQ
jgi:hypothetical protein